MLADHVVHVGGWKISKAPPAVIVVLSWRPRMIVLALGKQSPLDGLLQPRGFQLFERLKLVKPFDEKQISNLLDNFQRIGNTAGPERIPDLIGCGFRW